MGIAYTRKPGQGRRRLLKTSRQFLDQFMRADAQVMRANGHAPDHVAASLRVYDYIENEIDRQIEETGEASPMLLEIRARMCEIGLENRYKMLIRPKKTRVIDKGQRDAADRPMLFWMDEYITVPRRDDAGLRIPGEFQRVDPTEHATALLPEDAIDPIMVLRQELDNKIRVYRWGVQMSLDTGQPTITLARQALGEDLNQPMIIPEWFA